MFQNLRNTLVASLSAVDYRFVLEKNTGYFTNVLTMEVTRAVAFSSVYLSVLSYLINVAVFLVISCFINPQFTVIAVAFGAAVMFAFGSVATRAKHYSLRISSENAKLQALAIETVQSFKYLASTAGFAPVLRRFFGVAERLVELELKVTAVSSIIHGFSEPIVIMGMMVLVYYAVAIVGTSISSIVVAIMLFYRCMIAIMGVQKNWQTLSASTGGIETVLESISELRAHQERHGARPFVKLMDGIEFRHVSFAYAEKLVLEDVNLRIPCKSVVGIVGESGAGKSTFIDLITGMLKPTGGQVLIDGVNLLEIDRRDWRRRVGYVTQEGVLFDDTVARNISMWTSETDRGEVMDAVRQAARSARCDDFIETHPQAYEAVIGDRGVNLSGGQRQRLSIARELFRQPDVLILDEATSALDSELERDIHESIESLRGRATVIIIAHRLSTVRHCDRIIVLESGRLVEQGSFAELLARDGSMFARMCALQSVG
jgi:subfamily B ATP-binding cassette protein MsbA